jgi:ABC-type sugar transport system substrate-binding protein
MLRMQQQPPAREAEGNYKGGEMFSSYIRPLAVFILILGCVIAIAACGGSSSSSSESETSSSGESSEASESNESSEGGEAAVTVEVSWPQVKTLGMTEPKLSGNKYTVDLGAGQTATWTKGEPLKIAFFQQAESNTYLQALTKGIEDAGSAKGASVTVFDANFDPAAQRSQIQNALSSGKFNAAVVIPVESQGSCTQLTKEMPEGGMPAVVVEQETCGRDSTEGKELWSPGTIAYVGNAWSGYYKAFAKEAAAELKEPTETILIGGPAGNAPSNSMQTGAEEVAEENPNLELVDTARTDYTTPQALSATQNLLQAHPNVGAILLQYGGQIPGVVQALKQSSKSDNVKVFDAGGSVIEKELIEGGELETTTGQFPYTDGYCAVEMLSAMWEGKPVPRAVVNECHPTGSSPDVQTATVLNKSNIGKFEPEY